MSYENEIRTVGTMFVGHHAERKAVTAMANWLTQCLVREVDPKEVARLWNEIRDGEMVHWKGLPRLPNWEAIPEELELEGPFPDDFYTMSCKKHAVAFVWFDTNADVFICAMAFRKTK